MAGTAGPAMFDAYVAENYDSLVASFRYAAAQGIDPHDVVQDALLITYRKLVLEPEAFASKRLLHAYVRVVGTRLVTALMAAGDVEVPLTDDEVSVTRLDPERLIVSRDALERVLNRLSPRHLKALVMVVEGFSPDQIAETLHLPNRQAANAVVYRARVEARREFDLVRHAGLGALLGLRQMRDPSQTGAYASTLAGTVAFSLLTFVAAPVAPATPRRGIGGPPNRRQTLVGAGAPAPAPSRPVAMPVGPTGIASTHHVDGPDAAANAAPRRPPLSPLAIDPAAPGCIHVCVKSNGSTVRGEAWRLKPLGPGAPQVTQDITPLCPRMPDNPALACESGQEPHDWTVKDLPPIPVPEPGGTQS